MKEQKMFSLDDVFNIIDHEIKQQMAYKNAYIQKNGFKHKDVLNEFDVVISTLSSLYGRFVTK